MLSKPTITQQLRYKTFASSLNAINQCFRLKSKGYRYNKIRLAN